MRTFATIAIALLALPLVAAHPNPPHDQTLTIEDSGGDGWIYVKVCGVQELPTADPIAPDLSVSECLFSGVYEESNGVEELQVRAGTTPDDDGRPDAYNADERLLA